jgi:thiamine kinase-like enzyme
MAVLDGYTKSLVQISRPSKRCQDTSNFLGTSSVCCTRSESLVDKGVTDNRTAYSLRATTWISRVFFADNDQQPSNIIVREDIFVVLIDWEMAGFIGDLPAEARIADYEYRPGN